MGNFWYAAFDGWIELKTIREAGDEKLIFQTCEIFQYFTKKLKIGETPTLNLKE